MKILFINPSLRLGSPTKFLPVGLGYVMTFIHEKGYSFDLLDVDIDDLEDSEVEGYLSKNQYDIVLTGSIVSHYKWMKWLTKTIKKHSPETTIIVGNSVAGSVPELFLRNSGADIAVIGEGEIGALELIQAQEKGKSLNDIPGIAYIDKEDNFVKTGKRKAADINELPMIDWSLFEVQKYFDKSNHAAAGGLILNKNRPVREMPVVTARGCAFKCTFCHHVFWDDPYRNRSAENIIAEIKRNNEVYGATYINFWDDLSFSGVQQAERIVDAILKSKLKFNWSAAVRVDLFGHPRYSYERRYALAKKFKEAGCLRLGFSLESGNQGILDMMNKNVKAEYFLNQVELLRKVDIISDTSVVFGYPIETKETIKETFDMCMRGSVYPSIGFLLPLPYTGMYDYATQHGYITDEDAYLDSITERQDFCLNMTTMEDLEVSSYVEEEAAKLNKKLQLKLSESKLIKTGGYRKHSRKTSGNNNMEEN